MTSDEYMDKIYRLAHVKRYSNVLTIHQESVAEHTFFVAAIVMDLHTYYKFDLGKALLISIAHDMPEMELNDCPHNIKRDFPEIAEAFDLCEDRVAETLPTAVRLGYKAYHSDLLEAVIVHLADAMQCKQYAWAEMELGNKGYMKEVYTNSLYRVNKLKEELKEYERR